MSDPLAQNFNAAPLGDDYHDTISLLQEEIARLEEELRARDDALVAEPEPEQPSDAEAPAVDELRHELENVHGELAAKDEAISMLLEQTRLFEEAEAAGRAEWEQLHAWVEEVERRVGHREDSGDRLRQELDAERRQAEADRRLADTEKRSWTLQRKSLEDEAERLRGLLAQVAAQGDGAEASAVQALSLENQRLRATCEELAYASIVAAEVDDLREQLRATQVELDEAKHQLQHAIDERDRLRIEHEAEVAAIRKQLAVQSLAVQSLAASTEPEAAPAPPPEALREADERIRTLRQHLREIHEQEERERTNRKLSTRLSRLWRQTSPR